MKTALKLCLFLGLFMMAASADAQPVPTGTDYCDCLEGIQSSSDICDCQTGHTGGTGTGTGTTTNPTGNPPNPTGTGGAGPTGSFPLVFEWLECFFDPDCN